nr:D-glycero-beta-D-manno-heptose 1,7-bisphosphate 7-phosphatase [Atlantibacter sp.]
MDVKASRRLNQSAVRDELFLTEGNMRYYAHYLYAGVLPVAKSMPAIFLDRDGTINVDHGYVHEIDQFEFIDGVIDAMRELKEMGFALVLVTNQSGIARGKFTEAQFEILTEWMDWSLADRGVDLDGIYYCPHHPEGAVDEFRQSCDCRKPQPGMLISARDYLDIDMAASYMIGDKLEDMQAAQAAGVGTKVLVRSGKPVTEEAEKAADWVVDSLAKLPEAIKTRQKTAQ